MGAAETFEARGSGGVIFTFDVPAPGSRQEELLLEQFRRGDLIRVDEDGNDVPFVEDDEDAPEVVKVPSQRSRKKAPATKKASGRKGSATPRVGDADDAGEGEPPGPADED